MWFRRVSQSSQIDRDLLFWNGFLIINIQFYQKEGNPGLNSASCVGKGIQERLFITLRICPASKSPTAPVIMHRHQHNTRQTHSTPCTTRDISLLAQSSTRVVKAQRSPCGAKAQPPCTSLSKHMAFYCPQFTLCILTNSFSWNSPLPQARLGGTCRSFLAYQSHNNLLSIIRRITCWFKEGENLPRPKPGWHAVRHRAELGTRPAGSCEQGTASPHGSGAEGQPGPGGMAASCCRPCRSARGGQCCSWTSARGISAPW